jgi:hypothetical protein
MEAPWEPAWGMPKTSLLSALEGKADRPQRVPSRRRERNRTDCRTGCREGSPRHSWSSEGRAARRIPSRSGYRAG